MAQDDVERIIDSAPEQLHSASDVSKHTSNSINSTRVNLRHLRRKGNIGAINYKHKFYLYFSLKSERFRLLPKEVFIFNVIRFDKENCITWLKTNYGIK